MKHFTLSVAEGTTQNKNNAIYSTQSVIHDKQELLQAVQFDHVAGIFTNNHRSNNDFIQADCLIMDCDNDHTEDPAKWLTPKKLHEQLQGVAFYAVYSKSHMKDKDGKSSRPRFHVYMPLTETITDAERISSLKECLLAIVPEFDKGAKDAARFIYGVPNPEGELFEGDTCIDTYSLFAGIYADIFTAQQQTSDGQDRIDDDTASKGIFAQAIANSSAKPYFDFITNPDKIISEGNRHDTLLKIAVGALMNEDSDSARAKYEMACRQCRPPYDQQDIARIWQDAMTFTAQQETQHPGRKKRTPLSLPIISDFLKERSITVHFDVIKKSMIVSGFKDNDPALPPEYASLSDNDKRKQAPALLPLMISPIFRSDHFIFSDKFLTDCLEQIAKMNKYNPVKAMLDATQWDGKDRICVLMEKLELLHDRHGNKASYYCSCLRKWLHQAIALALNDEGTYKPAFVLTLQGRQGIGKTNFFRALAVRPEWFREGATIDTRDKDTIIQATAVWICELGELDATLRKEQSDLKSFLTRTSDTYRRPYARTEDTVERRTCFCATVNPQEVNRDITGSRRFVYINVDGMDKQFIFQTMTPDWVAQLWRQVYEELYLPNPEGYFLTDEDLQRTEQNNKPYRMPIKAETELRDLIAWEKIGQIDDEGYDTCNWQEYTSTEVKKAYKDTLRSYSANQIGQALKLLCEEYGATMRRLHGRPMYRIPKITNREDEDTSTRHTWHGYN